MPSFRRHTIALLLFAGLAGCVSKTVCPPTGASALAPGTPDWREAISDPDHVRLRNWRKAFTDSLAKARAAGFGTQIDGEGDLLNPDYALDGVTMPDGYYRCRVIKLGAKETGHSEYSAYPPHRCQIRPSDKLKRLVELDGLQRPSGRIYPDSSSRLVFLGTIVLGDETKPITYGRDQDRDVVGAIQRIGEKRWRMLIPSPAWESMMDVMELVPEGE
jgi:hypothetical protein